MYRIFLLLAFSLFTSIIYCASITISTDTSEENTALLRDHRWNILDTLTLNGKNQVTIDYTGYYFLVYNEMQISYYMDNQSDIIMSIGDGDSGQMVAFQGDYEKENNYLVAKGNLRNEIPVEMLAYSIYANLDEEKFLRQTDTLYTMYGAFLQSWKAKIPHDFYKLEQLIFQMEKKLRISQYQGQRRFITEDPDYVVPSSYPDPFKGYDFNDETLLRTVRYLDFMHVYFDHKSMAISEDGNYSAFFNNYIDLLSKSEFPAEATNQLAIESAQVGMKYVDDLDAYKDKIIAFLTIPDKKEEVLKLYKKKKQEKGQSPPDFEFPNIDGQLVKLSALKGKPVYIDIWASWCSPCISEFPHLKKLKEQYKDKVHFVGLGWNDKKAAWKKAIAKYSLDGPQLYAEDKDHPFFLHFEVSSIPRFILLDKDGKIVSARAIIPSIDGIKDDLNKLIQE